MLEKKIRQLIRNTYYAANQRIVFTSKPLLTPGGKDPISNLIKVWYFTNLADVVKIDCYIGLTTRHLR